MQPKVLHNSLITIITVVLNAKETIERAIKSVISQNYENLEYIIIDGGSTDGTLDIINKYKDRLSYFISEKDNGIYDAMNKGIRKATGDIIGLLNADDWYEANVFFTIANEFNCNNVDVLAGETWVFYKNGNKRLRGNNSFANLWQGMPVCHQAVFITKRAYDLYGLYDTRYKIVADYELLLRMYHRGAKLLQIKNVLVNYSATGISSTSYLRTAVEFNSAIELYIDKYPTKSKEISNLCKERVRTAYFRYNIENYPNSLLSLFNRLNFDYKKGIVIWGTGIWGRKIKDLFITLKIKVPFFVDNDEHKWNTKFYDMQIFAPSVLSEYEGNVFVAVKKYDISILEQLHSYNNSKLQWLLLNEVINEAEKHYTLVPPPYIYVKHVNSLVKIYYYVMTAFRRCLNAA